MIIPRNEVEATVLRLPGQLFEHKGENISNVFTYKIINKTTHPIEEVTFKLASHKGTITLVSNNVITVPEQGLAQGTFFIEIPKALLTEDKTKLKLKVYSGDKLIETTTTNFLGPRSYR